MDSPILIIHPDPITRKLLRTLLESEGYTPLEEVASIAEAARATTPVLPRIIVLGLRSSDADGLAFVRGLKSAPPTRGVPVLALGTEGTARARRTILEAGCDVYMLMPIDTRMLPRVIAEHLLQ